MANEAIYVKPSLGKRIALNPVCSWFFTWIKAAPSSMERNMKTLEKRAEIRKALYCKLSLTIWLCGTLLDAKWTNFSLQLLCKASALSPKKVISHNQHGGSISKRVGPVLRETGRVLAVQSEPIPIRPRNLSRLQWVHHGIAFVEPAGYLEAIS